jgi:Mrp family chromosome partitioning ATPase
VTTPQKLSFIDVLKGIQMFQDLRVRILGIVENMSHYVCGNCGTVDEVFGKGHSKMIIDQLGIENLFKIPLISELSTYSDSGTPAVLSLPKNHTIKQIYNNICTSIIK